MRKCYVEQLNQSEHKIWNSKHAVLSIGYEHQEQDLEEDKELILEFEVFVYEDTLLNLVRLELKVPVPSPGLRNALIEG